MTNETNPGTVEVTEADHRFAESISHMLEYPSMDLPKVAAKAARHRTAAQSQPAATVQEAGRECEQIVAWLNSEAQDCYDRMAADPESDLAVMYGQRHLYYKQAARMIGRGAHLTALTAEPAAKAGDTEIERRPEAEYWRGIRVVGYYYEVPTGLPEPSSQTMPKVDFHWSTPGQQQETERLVKLSDVLALVAPPSPQPDMGSGEA